jgi:hypothetical protein
VEAKEATMAILKIFGAAWLFLVAGSVTLAIVQNTPPQGPVVPSTRNAVTTDLGASEMLQSDMRMLEQMRISLSRSMNGMIADDPMWVDPVMIRGQEQYQAQIDRMLARR